MKCDRLERDQLLGHLGEQMDPHVDECGDCQTRRDEYLRLAGALSGESDHPLPQAWKQRTLDRLRAERRARRRRATALAAAGLAVATAAAVILAIGLKSNAPLGAEASVIAQVTKGAEVRRGDQVHPGDALHVWADAGEAKHFELRIYGDGRDLVLRCPGDAQPKCRVLDGAVEASLTIEQSESYELVFLVSSQAIPEPSNAIDADDRAALEAGAVVVDRRTYDVL